MDIDDYNEMVDSDSGNKKWLSAIPHLKAPNPEN
jgi:hypothetical protein